MSYFCVDVNCPNCEVVEDKMNCPECGAKSELVSYLYLQQLIDRKKRTQRLNENLLFCPGESVDDLRDTVQKLLDELVKLEVKKREDNEGKIWILLLKIQAVQMEIMVQTQVGFIAGVKRLMGL